MEDKFKNVVSIATGAESREMVREAITAMQDEFKKRLSKAKIPFIHPNLVTYHWKDASVNIDSVRGVVDHISLVRGDEVLLGDAGYYDTTKAFKKLGFDSLKRSGNLKFIDLNLDKTIEYYAYTGDYKKRPIGFSKTIAEADFNIVVVPAKMHSYTTVSLSVKTQTIGSQVVEKSPFGSYARWPWNHTGIGQIHHTMADTYEKYPAQMAVIDGAHAMEGNGPASGNIVNLGWVIVSFNPVTADAMAAYLMGVDPEKIGYLHHLNKRGFGPIDVAKMEVLGDDPDSLRKEIERPNSYKDIINSIESKK
ncbi:DUF362 domain-containing protein [Patescibacteria group bacterium]